MCIRDRTTPDPARLRYSRNLKSKPEMTQQLQTLIETAWDNRAELSPASAPKEVMDAVNHVIDQLNTASCAWPRARA